MEIKRVVRKRSRVEAVKVTEENLEELAEWCGGRIGEDECGNRFLKILKKSAPRNNKPVNAGIGEWIIRENSGFKIYRARAFPVAFMDDESLEKRRQAVHDVVCRAIDAGAREDYTLDADVWTDEILRLF